MAEQFELLKDIILPSGIMCAGITHTKEKWEELFPCCFLGGINHVWFRSTTAPQRTAQTIEQGIVAEIFNKRNLNSISARGAAAECITKYRKDIFDSLQGVLKEMTQKVLDCEEEGQEPNAVDWGHQQGVLISSAQARRILLLLLP